MYTFVYVEGFKSGQFFYFHRLFLTNKVLNQQCIFYYNSLFYPKIQYLMQSLANRVAIITGGARGIGKATAELFASAGAKVAIWDVQEDLGEQAAASIEGAKFYKVNVADFADVEAQAAKVVEDFGKIDILVNNAGITRDSSLKKMSAEQWQQVIDVNLTGVFNCTKHVSPYMSEAKYGRIINTSSIVALYGNFGQTNYVATKTGVIGMTKVWARELGRKNITVNAVAPGFIETEMIETVPEEYLQNLRNNTPLQRLGKPEDIANAYLFLASESAAYISGHVLSVDGGLTI